MFPTILIDCISSYEPHPPSSPKFPTTSPSIENYFDDFSDADNEFLDELDSICVQSFQNYPKQISIKPKIDTNTSENSSSSSSSSKIDEKNVSIFHHPPRPSSYVSESDDAEESSSWEVSDDETEEEWDEMLSEDDGVSSCCSSSCSSLASCSSLIIVAPTCKKKTMATRKSVLLSPGSSSSRVEGSHVWNGRRRMRKGRRHRRMGAFSGDLLSSFGKLNEFELTSDEKMNMKVCEREHNRLVRKDTARKLSRMGSMDCVDKKKLPFEEETFTQEIWNAWRLR